MMPTATTFILGVLVLLAFLARSTGDESALSTLAPAGPHGPAAGLVSGGVAALIVTEVISFFVQQTFLAWLPQFLAVVVFVATAPLYRQGGRYNREVYARASRGEHIAARTGATLLTVAYVLLAFLMQSDNLWGTFFAAVFMCGAAALAVREVLTPRVSLGVTFFALIGLLGTSVGAYFGSLALRVAPGLGLALLLLTATIVTMTLALVRRNWVLVRCSFVLGGTGTLIFGLASLQDSTADGVQLAVLGGAAAAFGILAKQYRPVMFSALMMLSGSLMLARTVFETTHMGPAPTTVAWILWALSCLLVGIAILPVRAIRRARPLLNGGSGLLVGSASLVFGAMTLEGSPRLFAVFYLLIGGVLCYLSTRSLLHAGREHRWWHRLKAYLDERPATA